MATQSRERWQNVVARKRGVRDAAIQTHLALANDEASEAIVNVDDVETLVRMIQDRQTTAQIVVETYIKRACLAQQKTNCLTEICFDEAAQQAKALDDHLEQTGQLVGPLHGVPVSLKDQFDIQGFDSTLGYVGSSFRPAASNALIVNVLQKLGAVVLAKTNLPQTIMWCETDNPLWGLTTNPRNPDFTPGGSSGGEGALLALRGSLLGFGTDIGGSVRIPSHINGLWGLKPSAARLSYRGVAVSTEGQQHVPSAVGPLARSLSSLTFITKSLIEAEPWLGDPDCVPIEWRQNVHDDYSTRKLVVGVMLDDGVVKVHPPIERVFREFVAKIEKAGHEVVMWNPSLHRECIAILDAYYQADGGEDIRRAIEEGGEPFIPHIEALFSKNQPISVYEYWQLNRRKIAAQRAYSDKWASIKGTSGSRVDVLLTPTMPHTALPHRGCRWVGYTKVWNVLDYTALSFPAGRASKDLDSTADPTYVPRNEVDAAIWSKYDAETMDGHPVGLQIVGRRYEEEKVLGVAKAFEKLLN